MGARRTGTTLVNQILCNEPTANPHVGECQILTRFCRDYRWSVENYDRVVQWYFDDSSQSGLFFRRIVADFLDTAAAHFGGPEFLVLKNPEFSGFKQELDHLLPDSRAIICVRDPRDQIVSELDVGKRQIEQGIDGRAAEAARNRDIEALAKRYMQYYRPILRNQRDTDLFVRYEDVVNDTQRALRDIEQFTGMSLKDYDPEKPWRRIEHMEQIQAMPAFVPQYGAALDPSRVGRFRDALSDDEEQQIAQICSEIIAPFYSS